MALTVGFDATAAARQQAGIGRYTRELLRALAKRDDDLQFRLFHAAGDSNMLPPLGYRFNVRALPVSDRVTNAIWHRARVPIPVQLVIGPFDLFHSPDFTAPPTRGKPAIITIHDLAFFRHPECAYPTLRAYLSEVVPRQARHAAHIITVSESSKCDVVELLGISEDRVTVAYPGIAEAFTTPVSASDAENMLQQVGIREPFILAVSTLEPRKNYERLVEAFAILCSRGLSHRLVIAGRKGWMYEPIFETLRERRLTDRVTVFKPDDLTLRALYARADVYVCASVYEGFGLAAAEALAAGAPVACTTAASLPEVVGGAALMFDPHDVVSMADAIERLVNDRELASSLRARGPAQAAKFSWSETAKQVLSVYEGVANG